jgi:hypothetical protein
MGIISESQVHTSKMKVFKNVNKNMHPKMIFFNEISFWKILIMFNIENWLWKSELSLNLEHKLIRIFKKPFNMRKFYTCHSINLPFDAKVAKKNLNGIYVYVHTYM